MKIIDNLVYFDEWLIENGYKSIDELREELDEDELYEEYDSLFEEFEEYCDQNDLTAMSC